jgi:hypothetical protein
MDIGTVSIYVRKGKAHIPTLAKTETGVYLTIDPVYTIDLNVDNLTTAINIVRKAGNPRIPHPTRDEIIRLPQPVLKASKVNSWKKMAEGGTSYTISFETENIVLYFTKLDEKARIISDTSKTLQFPPGTSIKDIVQAILDDVQSRPELY